jgi:hypothetical protein
MNNTKQRVLQILLLALFIFFQFGFFASYLSRCQVKKNLNYILETFAKDMNSECPIPIGNDLIIEKVSFVEKTIIYEYWLPNHNKDSLDLQSLKKNLSDGIIIDLERIKSLEKLRNNDVIFEYHYSDKQREKVLKIKVLFNTPITFID